MRRLAQDLELDVRTLQRTTVFARAYERPPETGLSWAHYRELLTVSEPAERAFYEELAVAEGLSRNRLQASIALDLYEAQHAPKRTVELPRPTEPVYLFKAHLLRVVDGDTLLV